MTVDSDDRHRLLLARYKEFDVKSAADMEKLFEWLQANYMQAEMAEDDIRDLDRRAKFDPTVL